MAQQQKSPVDCHLQQALEAKAAKGVLKGHVVTGKVSHDKCSKKLSLELFVEELSCSFQGTAELQEGFPAADIVGELQCEHPPCPGDETFDLIATGHVLFLVFKNHHHLPNKWLLTSPLTELAHVTLHGAGKWA